MSVTPDAIEGFGRYANDIARVIARGVQLAPGLISIEDFIGGMGAGACEYGYLPTVLSFTRTSA